MRSPNRVSSLVMVLLCAAAISPALGADLVLNRFDAATEVGSWGYWWGGAAPYSFTHDATMDANGNVNSGSLKLTAAYATALAGNNNLAFFRDLGGSLDLTDYGSLEFDFYIDPSSPHRGAGTDHGYFGTFLALDWIDNTVNPPVTHFWDNIWEGGRGLAPDSAWTHVSIPLSAYAHPHDIVHRIGLQNWGGDTGSELNGTLIMWIDNVVLLHKPGGPTSTLLVNDFNDASEVTAWTYDAGCGTPPCQPIPTIEFDPAADALGNPASGALKLTVNFDVALWGPTWQNQVLLNRNFPGAPADARDYDSFIARVKVDAGSARDGHNGHGAVSWVFRNTQNWSQWNPLIWTDLIDTGGTVDPNGWMNFEVLMPSGISPGRDQLAALTLQLFGDGGNPPGTYYGLTGPVTIWVDHIVLGRSNACADSGNCEACYDDADNNGNGLVDCADPDCAGIAHCIETTCNDFIDNEGDGKVDCADPDCAQDPVCHVNAAWADLDGDLDVDMVDFGLFQKCISGASQLSVGCGGFDRDHNLHIDSFDLSAFVACFAGPGVTLDSCPP
jgi:hypothetical protein